MTKKSSEQNQRVSALESTVERHLCSRAEGHGGAALKLRPPTGRGFPDRTVVLPGNWVAFVEVKRPVGGRVARQQEVWGEALRDCGQRFYIVSNFAEVDAIFLDYLQETTK